MTSSKFGMTLRIGAMLSLLGGIGAATWADKEALTVEPKAAAAETKKAAAEPEHITVQHLLIGYKGSVPGKNITRSKEEAKALAYDLLARVRKGEDYDALIKQYTDDAPPGIYSMANKGVAISAGEHRREGMVAAFGDVGFKLAVGDFGIADYSAQASPYGWHIIKRIK